MQREHGERGGRFGALAAVCERDSGSADFFEPKLVFVGFLFEFLALTLLLALPFRVGFVLDSSTTAGLMSACFTTSCSWVSAVACDGATKFGGGFTRPCIDSWQTLLIQAHLGCNPSLVEGQQQFSFVMMVRFQHC